MWCCTEPRVVVTKPLQRGIADAELERLEEALGVACAFLHRRHAVAPRDRLRWRAPRRYSGKPIAPMFANDRSAWGQAAPSRTGRPLTAPGTAEAARREKKKGAARRHAAARHAAHRQIPICAERMSGFRRPGQIEPCWRTQAESSARAATTWLRHCPRDCGRGRPVHGRGRAPRLPRASGLRGLVAGRGRGLTSHVVIVARAIGAFAQSPAR